MEHAKIAVASHQHRIMISSVHHCFIMSSTPITQKIIHYCIYSVNYLAEMIHVYTSRSTLRLNQLTSGWLQGLQRNQWSEDQPMHKSLINQLPGSGSFQRIEPGNLNVNKVHFMHRLTCNAMQAANIRNTGVCDIYMSLYFQLPQRVINIIKKIVNQINNITSARAGIMDCIENKKLKYPSKLSILWQRHCIAHRCRLFSVVFIHQA